MVLINNTYFLNSHRLLCGMQILSRRETHYHKTLIRLLEVLLKSYSLAQGLVRLLLATCARGFARPTRLCN